MSERGELLFELDRCTEMLRRRAYPCRCGLSVEEARKQPCACSAVPLEESADAMERAADLLRAPSPTTEGAVTGADADRIVNEMVNGTPDTPERVETIRRADEVYRTASAPAGAPEGGVVRCPECSGTMYLQQTRP